MMKYKSALEKGDRIYTPKGGIRVRFNPTCLTELGRMLLDESELTRPTEFELMVDELRRL